MADETQPQEQDPGEVAPAEATPEPQSPPVPVSPAPAAPQTVLGEVTARQPVEVADLSDRFAEVKRLIEADEMLSAGDKNLKLLQLDVMHEERQARIQNSQQSSEERTCNNYVKQYGSTREVVDSTWSDAVSESIRRRGKFDHGTALTVFESKMETAKNQPEPAPIVDPKPVGQTRTAPRGVRQAAPVPEKKMTVQEIMDRAAMGDTSAIPQDVLAEARR